MGVTPEQQPAEDAPTSRTLLRSELE